MANTTMDDGKLTESDLPDLLDLVAGIHWEHVGLELGLCKSEIDMIAADKQNDPERCNSEILYKWLTNSMNPTRKSLLEAIKRIDDRHIKNREGNKADTIEEERKVEEAVEHLATLLDDWEKTNKIIVSDHKELSANRKKEEELFQMTVKTLNTEEAEWCEGDTATQRANIVEALQKGKDFTDSSFVKTFLESKDLKVDISKMKDEVVGGLLRKALVEIDTDRLDTIGKHYSAMNEHFRKSEHLQTEITDCTILLEERLMTYNNVREGLKKLGVRTDRLIEQLQALQVTADECLSTKVKCEENYQNEKDILCTWKQEVDSRLKSFNAVIKQMELKQPAFEDGLIVLYAIATGTVGAVTGAMTGASIGTGIVPVIGTVAGGVAGGVFGTAAGIAYGLYRKQQAHEDIDRHVRNYRETLQVGRYTRDKLNKLLAL